MNATSIKKGTNKYISIVCFTATLDFCCLILNVRSPDMGKIIHEYIAENMN